MKMHPRLKPIVLITLLLSLTACNKQISKEETPKVDAFETERLAVAAYEDNNWLEGEKHYSELVRRIPENPVHWFRLGNIYARTQRPDAAIVSYREALVRNPEMTKAWFNMGVLQLRQAANSFDQLRVYADRDNPLYPQGIQLLDGIVDLMQGRNKNSEVAEQLIKAFEPGEKIELLEEDNQQTTE